MKPCSRKQLSQNRSWTGYGKTLQSFTNQSKNLTSTVDLTAYEHSEQGLFQTRNLLVNKHKRRSFAERSIQSCLLSEPAISCTPERPRTAIGKTTFNERLTEMINHSKEKVKKRFNSRRKRKQKITLQKSQEDQLIQQALLQIEQENKYHTKFMEVIKRKVSNYCADFKPKLRQANKVEKFITQPVYQQCQSSDINDPHYLGYISSFYSRSKRRCFKDQAEEIYKKYTNQDEAEKSYFSYLQFVADLHAKKKFLENFKTKKNFDGVDLMKSKQKILSLWKNGSRNREIIKVLIEEILKEKKLI